MSKKIPIVVNQAKRSAEISLRGSIGDWFYDAEAVAMQLEGLDVDVINLRINSLGGYAHDGIAIYNLLKSHPAKVVGTVEGVAASAASIALMAADEIEMYPSSQIMVHGVTVINGDGETEDGNPAEQAFNASLIGIYASRTGKQSEEIAEIISRDTWMSAEAAVAAGFADRILSDKPVSRNALSVIAAATGIPEAVFASLQPESAVDPAQSGEEDTEQPDKSADTNVEPMPETAAEDAPIQNETFAGTVMAHAKALGVSEDHARHVLLDTRITTTIEAIQGVIEINEIIALCKAVNVKDDVMVGFIAGHKTLAEARAAIIEARAAEDEAIQIDSTPPMTADGNKQSTGISVTDSIYAARKLKKSQR